MPVKWQEWTVEPTRIVISIIRTGRRYRQAARVAASPQSHPAVRVRQRRHVRFTTTTSKAFEIIHRKGKRRIAATPQRYTRDWPPRASPRSAGSTK